MKSKGISSPRKSAEEPVLRFVAVIGLVLTHALPASANQSGEPVTRAPSAPATSEPHEMLYVEDVPRHRSEGETSMQPSAAQNQPPPARSAMDLHDTYESKRIAGIVTAGILAPVFAGFTAMGTYLLYRHARDDGGGFCTHITRDSDNDYQRTCEGDRGELAGIIIVSTAGGILTLAMLISGVVKISRSSRRLRRLSFFGARPDPRPGIFSFTLSEREVSLGFSF